MTQLKVFLAHIYGFSKLFSNTVFYFVFYLINAASAIFKRDTKSEKKITHPANYFVEH